MKKILIKVTAAVLILNIAACKKDADGPGKSKTELITQAPWKTVNQEFNNGAGYVVSPDWSSAEACTKDDLLVVRSNMTYEENEGATKCDPSDPQVYGTGTWAWHDNETKVVIDGQVGTVTELNNNTLQITAPINFGTQTVTLRVTYGH